MGLVEAFIYSIIFKQTLLRKQFESVNKGATTQATLCNWLQKETEGTDNHMNEEETKMTMEWIMKEIPYDAMGDMEVFLKDVLREEPARADPVKTDRDAEGP